MQGMDRWLSSLSDLRLHRQGNCPQYLPRWGYLFCAKSGKTLPVPRRTRTNSLPHIISQKRNIIIWRLFSYSMTFSLTKHSFNDYLQFQLFFLVQNFLIKMPSRQDLCTSKHILYFFYCITSNPTRHSVTFLDLQITNFVVYTAEFPTVILYQFYDRACINHHMSWNVTTPNYTYHIYNIVLLPFTIHFLQLWFDLERRVVLTTSSLLRHYKKKKDPDFIIYFRVFEVQ